MKFSQKLPAVLTKKNTTEKSVAQKQKTLLETLKGLLYLAPALVGIIAFVIYPLINTIYLSFTNYNLYHWDNYVFIGFENYTKILTNKVAGVSNIFLPVFGWTFVFAILSVAGTYLVGLVAALLLSNKHMKEAQVYKGILIVPWALPATIAIMAWYGLYNEQYGAINLALQNLHIISKPIPWLNEPFWARAAVIIVNLWLGFPYMMNVCIGGISAIPETYYEAADLDGATRFQKFAHITLPSLTRISYPLLISSFAFNFNNFASSYLLTDGGPARAESQFAGYTDILASSVYKMSLTFNRFDYGATFAVLLFLIIGSITLIQMIWSGQFKEVE